MTATPLPYFFDEAEQASRAKQPGDREKALNFTQDDLNWLKTVYKATQDARKTDNKPMLVYRLLLNVAGKPDIPLAGSFAMSRLNDGEVVLYTPWKGLIRFADMMDLKNKLKEWLEQDSKKRELLRFLSIDQRSTLPAATAVDISTEEMEGAVFQDQTLILERNQAHNIEMMMGELLKSPTLQSMLDETLKIALHKRFPKLDQRLTLLETYINKVSTSDNSTYRQKVSSLSLSDALLQFYLTNQWPRGDLRSFFHPAKGVSNDAENQAWESEIREIAHSFTPHLRSLLETFWNTPMSHGQSREAYFTECLRDTYLYDLLLKHKQGVLTTQQYVNLTSVSTTDNSLRIEKVRVSAPFKHYAELAATLMIGTKDTLGYLYTQARGIEIASDLPTIKKIVLQMTNAEGHEDTLLNFMSLDERGTFVSLPPDERMIIGQPIVGAVFEQLMADILAKQTENLSFALARYRESEGMLDPHALFDKALDVRGLIDNRLLASDAEGRWSTQTDLRHSAQPATVSAESAKVQLALLNTVKQALDLQLEKKHPVIPASARTLAEVQRIVETSISPLQSMFTHCLSTALHSELKLRAVTRTLGATEQVMIKTLLDTPVRIQRAALNGFLPDVFSLVLQAGGTTVPLNLASCFVLTERGGLDPVHSGKAILWTPAFGYEAFKTLPALLNELERRLKDDRHRLPLLENLDPGERLPGRVYTLAPLQRIDGHFLDHVQKNHVHLDEASVAQALATSLEPKPLASLFNLVTLRLPLTGLRRATDLAQSLINQQKLPAWLAKAPIKELRMHGELLQQYLDNVKDDQDYLSGLDSLARTAHQELAKQLKADTFNIDPDQVQIKVEARPTSGASTQTLTHFALTHFKELDQARFTAESLNTTVLPEGMDESYIKGLIRNLKLGEQQQKKLNQAFTDTPANTERRTRFYWQLPWQLMHYAHTQKLQENLSEAGFDLVRQVMDMPDAIARAAVDGAHAIIRPLEFTGSTSEQTIKVPGVYLIGSTASHSTHQVLIAPHSPRHGLKEYENEQQLLAELKTRGHLFNWILLNLPPADRVLLKSRLVAQPNRVSRNAQSDTPPSSGVTLAHHPIRENLFNRLLNDNVALLGRLLGCQADETNQNEWATIKNVLSEDLHEAFSFCMGKLAYPLTVWRSYRDIKQSAEDLQSHKWRAATTEFISGIAQLATLQQSLEPESSLPSSQDVPVPAPENARFKWQDINVTSPKRTHLKLHVSNNVDLGSLTLDSTLALYSHPTTKQHYAAVEGKVYPAIKHASGWNIGDKKTRGPHLRQNAAKQWIIMQNSPNLRFGLLSRLDTLYAALDAMYIDARGMAQIRQRYPLRALEVEQALDLATTYAWNSLRNLQLLKAAGGAVTPVHQLIMDFTDGSRVLPVYVPKLEKIVGDIFTALIDPTLRNKDSRRFVAGRAVGNPNRTFAITIAKDAKQKIYLAELFFNPPFDNYRPHLTDATFPINAHARAMTLIHELSHIVCDTADIAYIDPGKPFVDLISTASAAAIDLKSELSDEQDTALSIRTPDARLFKDYDAVTSTWMDLGHTSDQDTEHIKQRILALTGAKTLSSARTVFKSNPLIRLDVKLANADSVALLIGNLGRQLHVTTP